MRKIIFLGQKVIAERCAAVLWDARYSGALEVALIVSTPESYRKMAEVFDGAPPFVSNSGRNEREILDGIRTSGVDTLISVQHPWILSRDVIEAAGGFAFNLHNARLPDYRGHNSISHAILNGEKTYATTIHWMAPRVDTGDVAYEEEIPVAGDDTAWSLYQKSVEAAVVNFRRLAEAAAAGAEIPRKPITGEGTFYGKDAIHALKEIKSPLDFKEVDLKSRAFYFPPFEPAYFLLNGVKFYVSKRPY